MKKVAFICVHNSCRSQIAEVLGKHFASDMFESYSAGTETKPQINQDAVRLIKDFFLNPDRSMELVEIENDKSVCSSSLEIAIYRKNCKRSKRYARTVFVTR